MKYFLFLILLFIIPFSFGLQINNSHGITLDTTSSADIAWFGYKIITNFNLSTGETELNITGVFRTTSDDTSTRLYIYNVTSEDLMANVSWVGNKASPNIILQNNSQYYIVTGSDGASYTRDYKGSVNYPINATLFEWNSGWYFNSATSSFIQDPTGAYGFDIIELTSFEVSYNPPTPADGAKNNTQITINATCGIENLDLWFDGVKVINNQPGHSTYTTSVTTSANYTYVGSCDGGVNNGSTRLWIYDETDPQLYLPPTNYFDSNGDVNDMHLYSEYLLLNFSMFDDHLLGYNFSIYYTNGTVLATHQNTTLTPTTAWANHTYYMRNWEYGEINIDFHVADSHTANLIKPYEHKLSKNSIRYLTDEGNNISLTSKDNADFSTTKHFDRYDFTLDFKDALKKDRVIDVKATNNIIYLPNSGYKCHFVVFNEYGLHGNWIDFEGVDTECSVSKVNDKHYQVTLKNLHNKVTFNSLGGLNVAKFSYTFLHAYDGVYEVFIYEPDGTLLDFPQYTIEGQVSNTNPVTLLKNQFNDSTNYTAVVEDREGNFLTINHTFLFNYNESNTSVTMSNAITYIVFNKSVDARIQTLYKVWNYTNINNLWINTSEFNSSPVIIQFAKTGLDKFYQVLMFPADVYPANLSVFVYDNITTDLWIQVSDQSGDPIPGAILSVYQTGWLFDALDRLFGLTSEFVTNDLGKANLVLDMNRDLRIAASANGYTTRSIPLARLSLSNYTEADPYLFFLPTIGKSIFAMGVYQPRYFWNRSASIPIQVEYEADSTLTFRTDYMIDENYPPVEMNDFTIFSTLADIDYYLYAQKSYYGTLQSGLHYNSSGAGNISVNYYVDGIIYTTKVIQYLDLEPVSTADIGEELKGTVGYDFFLFLAIIFLAVIIQLVFRTEQGSVGTHTFLLGSILLSVFSSTFYLLSVICIAYYILKVIKPLVGTPT